MKPVLLALGVFLFTVSPLSASAADCRAIVANTLAELKAAYPEWDESMETLVRTAAGSACVKAAAAQPAPAASAPQMQEQAVRADGDVVPMAPAPAASTVSSTTVAASEGSADASSSESAEAKADDGDSGWNPFKEIKFNKVSASPNKKPYERRREVNKAAPAEDEDE